MNEAVRINPRKLRARFRDYVHVAIAELGLDVRAPSALKDARAWEAKTGQVKPVTEQPAKWFRETWRAVAARRCKRVLSGDDDIDKWLAGGYDATQDHLEVLHEVLGLSDYGLTVAETWKAPDETALRHDPDGFRALLRAARLAHRDPLHLLRAAARPDLVFSVAPDMALMFAEAEASGAPPGGGGDVLAVHRGTVATFRAVPQVTGPLLLISHIVAEGRAVVLNEALGQARSTVHAEHDIVDLGRRPINGEPGERELFAINWPGTVAPGDAGLDGLFERTDPAICEAELRRLGSVVTAQADHPDAVRARVNRMRLRIT